MNCIYDTSTFFSPFSAMSHTKKRKILFYDLLVYFLFESCFFLAFVTAEVTDGAEAGIVDVGGTTTVGSTSTISNLARLPNRERTKKDKKTLHLYKIMIFLPLELSEQSQICKPFDCPPKANVNGQSGFAKQVLI